MIYYLAKRLGASAMFIRSLIILGLATMTASADEAWYTKAVKKVELSIEPAEAKPGQTVTVKLLVDLNPGYHTYPTKQPDENAANFVNKLLFPAADTLIFVGETQDPAEYDTKAEPDLMIKDLRTLPGKVVYERKAVVSPKAAVGEATITVKDFRLSVCDAKNCFPAKKMTPAATIKVATGSVAVAKEFADEVKKALESK
jgi:hypothetical protein